MERRPLVLADPDAVIAEIRRLQRGGYTMLGKWTLTQMCQHIAGTLRVGLDADGKRMPWLLRKLIAEPMVRRVTRTGKMISGFPAPKELVPTAPSGPDDPAVIDDCIAVLERARDTPGPLPPHPMADMTLDQWRRLNCVHAAHHLSFLVPKDAAPSGAVASASAQIA